MSFFRRRRSNDGINYHAARVIGLRPSLVAANPVERPAAKKPDTFHGPKAARGAPAPKHSDATVLAVRALAVFKGMRPKAISDVLALALNDVRQILEFRNRVHLEPTEADLPEKAA